MNHYEPLWTIMNHYEPLWTIMTRNYEYEDLIHYYDNRYYNY